MHAKGNVFEFLYCARLSRSTSEEYTKTFPKYVCCMVQRHKVRKYLANNVLNVSCFYWDSSKILGPDTPNYDNPRKTWGRARTIVCIM